MPLEQIIVGVARDAFYIGVEEGKKGSDTAEIDVQQPIKAIRKLFLELPAMQNEGEPLWNSLHHKPEIRNQLRTELRKEIKKL